MEVDRTEMPPQEPTWIYRASKRRYICGDPFFLMGDMERGRCFKIVTAAPQVVTDTKPARSRQPKPPSPPSIRCTSDHCNLLFSSVSEYEEHYSSAHRNACQTCKRVLPTLRLLDLHIQETHDSLFKVMADRQKMYACFVEGCLQKFSDSNRRKLHLIDKHKYPKTFQFFSLSDPPPAWYSKRHHHPKQRPFGKPAAPGENENADIEEMMGADDESQQQQQSQPQSSTADFKRDPSPEKEKGKENLMGIASDLGRGQGDSRQPQPPAPVFVPRQISFGRGGKAFSRPNPRHAPSPRQGKEGKPVPSSSDMEM